MWIRPKIWLIALLGLFPICGFSHNFLEKQSQDTIHSLQNLEFKTIIEDDTATDDIVTQKTTDEYKPNPNRAIWLGAVIPGYGQILNRKYWKLPIVYGGFLGCFYAINWNSRQFITYKNAYLDITDSDDNTTSYLDIIPPGYTIESYGGVSSFTNMIKTGMDKSRYNRDLSIIISVAYYGLTLIDAFVDAHLYDFDISTDLSLKIKPTITHDKFLTNQNTNMQLTYGLCCSFKF